MGICLGAACSEKSVLRKKHRHGQSQSKNCSLEGFDTERLRSRYLSEHDEGDRQSIIMRIIVPQGNREEGEQESCYRRRWDERNSNV